MDPRKVSFDLQEVAAALIAARGITSGYWKLAIGVNFAASTMEWKQKGGGAGANFPTAHVAIGELMLLEEAAPGPLVFDAETGRLAVEAVPRRKAPSKESLGLAEKKTGQVGSLGPRRKGAKPKAERNSD